MFLFIYSYISLSERHVAHPEEDGEEDAAEDAEDDVEDRGVLPDALAVDGVVAGLAHILYKVYDLCSYFDLYKQ